MVPDFRTFRPDMEQLYRVLKRETSERPVLFEFILNLEYCREFSGRDHLPEPGTLEQGRMVVEAFSRLGYDCAPVYTWQSGLFSFPKGESESLASRSQNQGFLITDRRSFDRYPWPDPKQAPYDIYHDLGAYLPDGMKLMGFSNGGILENATDMVGFENLCMLYLEDPELTGEIFGQIGRRLLEYYRIVAAMDTVGVCVVNDDWGFRTQTMFPPEMMEQHVFPFTRRIVEEIHRNGKPAILHSCGNLTSLMDVVIDDLGLDGKHSFEDGILPVEDAWDRWHDRIAIIGGIDMDFLVRKSPDEIYRRSLRMLERSAHKGGYALGSGNSIPSYVPAENYLAMLRAAADFSA